MARFTARTDATELPVSELQLATLVDAAPEGPEWLHEQKFDGYRILAELRDGRVRLLSRRFKDWTAEFPAVADAVRQLGVKRAVIDGEVAAVMPDGRTSFQALQNARAAGAQLVYFVFDVLDIDGEDVAKLPLEARKARLQQLVRRAPAVIKYSDHVEGSGAAFFALACKQGLEGIISKRRDRPYQPGRGPGWVKTKCLLRQELVIGGYTEPERSRVGIGALLVGYYEDGELRYAGKVGTGFSQALLIELRGLLEPLEQAASPFSPEPPRAWTGADRHWVAPKLVGEVSFGEWTNDGRLRHPSFQGLRRDKLATDVVREAPVSGGVRPRVGAEPAAAKSAAKATAAKTTAAQATAAKTTAGQATAGQATAAKTTAAKTTAAKTTAAKTTAAKTTAAKTTAAKTTAAKTTAAKTTAGKTAAAKTTAAKTTAAQATAAKTTAAQATAAKTTTAKTTAGKTTAAKTAAGKTAAAKTTATTTAAQATAAKSRRAQTSAASKPAAGRRTKRP